MIKQFWIWIKEHKERVYYAEKVSKVPFKFLFSTFFHDAPYLISLFMYVCEKLSKILRELDDFSSFSLPKCILEYVSF